MTPQQEFDMFGCTLKELSEANRALGTNCPRDLLMFAMSVLSDAQEIMVQGPAGREHARKFINRAKYAVGKAMNFTDK